MYYWRLQYTQIGVLSEGVRRESMTETDIDTILQGAKEKFPESGLGSSRTMARSSSPRLQRVHSDLAHDACPHVAVLPGIEREDRALAQIAHRGVHPARNAVVACLVIGYVDHCNNVRLNSATGYITPKNMLAGRQREIHAERDRKLELARTQRQVRRQQAA